MHADSKILKRTQNKKQNQKYNKAGKKNKTLQVLLGHMCRS
jgi:hypothetical protein